MNTNKFNLNAADDTNVQSNYNIFFLLKPQIFIVCVLTENAASFLSWEG